jgi:hypothetical protein
VLVQKVERIFQRNSRFYEYAAVFAGSRPGAS